MPTGRSPRSWSTWSACKRRLDWTITRGRDSAVLSIRPWVKLSRNVRADITEEGGRLLAFAAPDVLSQDLRFLPLR